MTSFLRLLFACSLLTFAAGAFAQSPTERAEALLDKGEFLAAERLIESLALAKKPDPVAVWELSRVRTGQHQTEEAIRLAEKAIKLDSQQARFHAQLGMAIIEHMSEISRLDQSSWGNRMRKSFEKALALDPNNLVALAGLCRYYWSTAPANGGDLAKALQFAERIRKIDPLKGELELGAVQARKGDFPAALKHFETATELNPTHADAQISCGHVLLRLGRLREARERYEAALQISPKSETARAALEAVDLAAKAAAAKQSR
jgi:tetratricopeptide (TPR) repeat protein